MKLRTLLHILRIEGLIPFTGCAILIGVAVTLWETGPQDADWSLFLIAAFSAFLVHVDSHIWNDITDLEIDRQEKSRETGRDRPLVYGWATISDYKRISLILTTVVVILTAYLTLYRIWMPLFVLAGFFFDYGYNHPRIALGHRPFTEWYIFPWLVVGVTITIVYAATGSFSSLAFILSLLHGMTVTCFGVSMMRRDTGSDKLGGKHTTSVEYPDTPHSTIYGIMTMLIAVIMIYPLTRILGSFALAYTLGLTTAVFAAINTALGARIDHLCTRAMYSVFPDFEGSAHKLMLQQVGASMVHAVAVSIILLLGGGIV